jgi:hypothetical protein
MFHIMYALGALCGYLLLLARYARKSGDWWHRVAYLCLSGAAACLLIALLAERAWAPAPEPGPPHNNAPAIDLPKDDGKANGAHGGAKEPPPPDGKGDGKEEKIDRLDHGPEIDPKGR